jgi:hypothetical protein
MDRYFTMELYVEAGRQLERLAEKLNSRSDLAGARIAHVIHKDYGDQGASFHILFEQEVPHE